MIARQWTLLGLIWTAGFTVLGLGVLFAPIIIKQIRPGQGTALLLIAASILFAAVFPTLMITENRLVSAAGVLTALFGYAGTLIILVEENPILAVIILSYTVYLALSAFILVAIFHVMRIVFSRFNG